LDALRYRSDFVTSTFEDRECLASEIYAIEALFLPKSDAQNAAIQAACEAAQRSGDNGLLGRILSLRARVEIVEGRLTQATETVERALAAFGSLNPTDQMNLSGPFAEAWRVAGNVQLHQGKVVAGLNLLEKAVAFAERGLSSRIPDERGFSAIPTTSAVVRCLNNLGFALIAINEMKSGLAVL